MKIKELSLLPEKSKRYINSDLLDGYVERGYNSAVDQIGEIDLELDVEEVIILINQVVKEPLGAIAEAAAQNIVSNLKSILKVKGSPIEEGIKEYYDNKKSGEYTGD